MAWNFNGTTDYLTAGAAPVAAPPLTIACWFRKSAFASSFQEAVSLTDAAVNQEFALMVGSGGVACVGAFSLGAGGGLAVSTTTFSLGQWYHGAVVFAANDQRHAYLNGGGKGSDSTSVTPTAISRSHVGHGFVSYFPGDVAEVAVWNAALSDAEIAMLAKGFSPLCLLHRLANLVMYQDLIRPLNRPGVGPSFSTVGGPSVASHPGIIYPWQSAVSALRMQMQFLDFYRVATAQAHANAVRQGWAAMSGAELGSTYPIGEVSN